MDLRIIVDELVVVKDIELALVLPRRLCSWWICILCALTIKVDGTALKRLCDTAVMQEVLKLGGLVIDCSLVSDKVIAFELALVELLNL